MIVYALFSNCYDDLSLKVFSSMAKALEYVSNNFDINNVDDQYSTDNYAEFILNGSYIIIEECYVEN